MLDFTYISYIFLYIPIFLYIKVFNQEGCNFISLYILITPGPPGPAARPGPGLAGANELERKELERHIMKYYIL